MDLFILTKNDLNAGIRAALNAGSCFTAKKTYISMHLITSISYNSHVPLDPLISHYST